MGLFASSMPPTRRTEPLRRAATAALVAAVAGTKLWLGGGPPGAAVLAALLCATALGLLVDHSRTQAHRPTGGPSSLRALFLSRCAEEGA